MTLLPLHIRKPLTPLQRVKMFRDHDGICCICGYKIDGVREKWVDEHDPDNRGPAHYACAKSKTRFDQMMIAKAKRLEANHNGAKHSTGKLQSRGFQQYAANTKYLDWGVE